MEQCVNHRKSKIHLFGYQKVCLCAPLVQYDFMQMKLSDFPEHIIQQYDLISKAKNRSVYIKIWQSIYSFPQSYLLHNKLHSTGHYEVSHILGLWKHTSLPNQFTLVVDDFGVKYSYKQDVDHLIRSLERDFIFSDHL